MGWGGGGGGGGGKVGEKQVVGCTPNGWERKLHCYNGLTYQYT